MIPGIFGASAIGAASSGSLDGILFSNVVLQLHFDGEDGDTATTDSSSYGHTIGASGVQIDTAESVFGGSSAYIPASTNAFTVPGHAAMDMGGAFQFDLRYRLAAGITLTDNDTVIDTLFSDVNGTSYAYEWALLLHRTYMRFYCGIRGTNNRSTRFFLPPGLDFADFDGQQCALSMARDVDGNWGAWAEGQRCPDYQTGNFSAGTSYNARVNGAVLNDTTDFGNSSGRTLRLGSFGTFGGLAQSKHVDEFRWTVNQSRDVTQDYTPLAVPFPNS